MSRKKTWIIGCDPACDLGLDRPSVSWRHSRLRLEDDGSYFLEDLGSTNGTFVNGKRIFAETRVSRQDSVTLGLSVALPWPSEPRADELPLAGPLRRIGREPEQDSGFASPEAA